MAKTIAIAKGYDRNRLKVVHRLGSQVSEAQANTWRTFATAYIRADGSGFVSVVRDGKRLDLDKSYKGVFEFGPE